MKLFNKRTSQTIRKALISCADKMFDNHIKCMIWTVIETAFFTKLLHYFWLTPLNIHSVEAGWFVVIALVIALLLGFFNNAIRKSTIERRTGNYFYCKSIKDFPKYYTIPFILIIMLIVLVITFILVYVAGSPMVNAKSYSNLITIEDGDFAEDVIEIDSDDIVVVDVKTAQRLGDRTIGTITNASWYEVDDEYNLISINGEKYRVSPVNYKGMFEWFKAKETGIPGYVLVNVKNQEAKFVPLEQGMKYSPSAFFSYDLNRHLFKQYPTYIFGKSFFEVDDEGNPYWITSFKDAKIGLMGGQMDVGAVITDATTGESRDYTIEEMPEWVDHVSSVSYLMDVIRWHYRYANGFINPSNTGVYKTSYSYRGSKSSEEENDYTPFDGYNSVFSKDGELMFYTGITPANNAESNIGFVLVSPRTGKVIFYDSTGAEESSAQLAAEGLVQNLKYSASFPTIVNVDGIETYFMVLKDNGGLVHKYALCNLNNYASCVEDDTLDGAIAKYRKKMGVLPSDNDLSDSASEETEAPNYETATITGKVLEVKEAQIEGFTYYYFTLDADSETIFMSSIQNSNMQPLKLVSGVEVTITYYTSTTEEKISIVTDIEF